MIAEASHGAEVARFGRLAFDVAAQADDEIVDGPRVGVFVEIPDVLQDCFARDRMATVLDKIAEELGLHQGKLKDLVSGAQLKALKVDELAVELESLR